MALDESVMIKTVLSITALVLVGAFGLRVYFSLVPPPEATLTQPLSVIVPGQIDGWTVRTIPMDQSPEAAARIENFLNFDDAIFRVFEQGDTMIGLYIAYWTPGKTSYRWAGVHTPDTCWVQAGWVRKERESAVPLASLNTELKPAEFGIYAKDGLAQHVFFWHLVGGEPYRYNQQGLHNIWASLVDVREFGLNLRKEQFFVRLSSNRPLAELERLAGFDAILASLTEIGLELSPDAENAYH
jgi:hypothetical protein